MYLVPLRAKPVLHEPNSIESNRLDECPRILLSCFRANISVPRSSSQSEIPLSKVSTVSQFVESFRGRSPKTQGGGGRKRVETDRQTDMLVSVTDM